MQARTVSATRGGLRRLWRRWTGIVELYARRLPRRGRIDPWSYRGLHHELLDACKTLADDDRNGKRAFYEHLHTLARPWLTTWVLEQSDREVLFDLLERCQRSQRELNGYTQLIALLRPVVLVIAFLGSALLTGFLVWYTEPSWSGWFDLLDDYRRLFLLAMKRLTSTEWLYVLGGVGVVLGMVIVSRMGWRR